MKQLLTINYEKLTLEQYTFRDDNGILQVNEYFNSKYDLSNKKASYDILSRLEVEELKKRNRHKYYRSWGCLFCGKPMSFVSCNKSGKAKDYCDFSCNKRYAYFMKRIAGVKGPKNLELEQVQIFIEHCKVEMIFRKPVEGLNDQLKLLCRKSGEMPMPLIPSQPLIKSGKRSRK